MSEACGEDGERVNLPFLGLNRLAGTFVRFSLNIRLWKYVAGEGEFNILKQHSNTWCFGGGAGGWMGSILMRKMMKRGPCPNCRCNKMSFFYCNVYTLRFWNMVITLIVPIDEGGGLITCVGN